MAITLSGDGIARANLAADIIDSTKLADDAVNSEHYADGSIDNAHIADDAIDSEHYAAGSIDTAHIANDQITAALMADNSIDSDMYVDGSIDNAHLADDAVGVAELSATGTASSSTYLRGDNSWATAGGDNTPAFLAKPAIADSSLSDDTWTKVDYTEVVDSDGCYSSGRFTPAVVGYYQFNATAEVSTSSVNAWAVYIALYKNGSIDNSTIMYIDGHAGRAAASMSTSGVIYLDADDYIEVFAKQNTQGLDFAIGTEGQFSAFKLIGV